MKPVDAHCHLDFDQFSDDREEVVDEARQQLEFVVNAGTGPEGNEDTLDLAGRFPDTVEPALGLHPTNTEDFSSLDRVRKQIRDHDPAAVGEIGLDHYHVDDSGTRREQEKVFLELLELAEEVGKPVVVHSREAEEKAVELVDRYSLPGVMLHCFNGEPELAETAAGKGMKIGVTTQVLESSRVQNIVDTLDPGDMLLETDSPFLYRDRNRPVNVVKSAEKIAEIKSLEREEVVEETTSNARELFL